MAKFYLGLERILLTLWIGGSWVVGYIVAPVLFSMLADRNTAALVAGKLFNLMSLIGFACGAGLLALLFRQSGVGVWKRWQTWLLTLLLLSAALGYFYFSPAIEAMRQSGEAARASREFKWLHGLSAILYLLSSVAGGVLVLGGIQRRE
ncbi:MAG: DUF4149 domain-containing protein [Gammaproteobacteria bacterium]|nr:DUF4149 domain-containing protein [Gammaproteobacteria bacterium]